MLVPYQSEEFKLAGNQQVLMGTSLVGSTIKNEDNRNRILIRFSESSTLYRLLGSKLLGYISMIHPPA